jgi:hypothetical protein
MRIASLILKNDLPIHIYGADGLLLHSHREQPPPWQLRGTFSDPLKPYIDYAFTIVVEDFPSPHFFGPAIQEALACQCMPVYLGAENADTFFPHSLISLAGKLDQDMRLIGKIIVTPETFYKDGPVNTTIHVPWLTLFSPSEKIEEATEKMNV